MRKSMFAGPVVVVLLVLPAGTADAQSAGPRVGAPAAGPTVSPYVNLLRNPNSPTLNYYGLVRPQFQTNAGLQALQQQMTLGQGGPLPGAGSPDDVLITGHAAVFMNLGGYFQSATGALRPAPLAAPRTGPSPGRLPRLGPR